MNFPNHNISVKPIFLASIVLSFVAAGFILPSAYAEHPPGFDEVTKTVTEFFTQLAEDPIAQTETYSFRDVNNPLDQVDENGDTLTTTNIESCGKNQGCLIVTITDADANLDSEGIDKVIATITSSDSENDVEIVLDETGENSGVFVGTVNIDKNNSGVDLLQVKNNSVVEVIYDPEVRGVGRGDFQIGYFFTDFIPAGTETVVMKDVIVTDECPNTNPPGIVLVTHPIDFDASDVTANSITVTLAATNAIIAADPFPTDDLKVIYKSTAPGAVWEDLSQGDASNHDIDAGTHTGTISNVFQPSTSLRDKDSVVQPGASGDVSGQYALGAQIGCPGGGGGGLVRPSLVVNALAGANVVTGLFGSGGGANGGSAPAVLSGSVSSSDTSIGFEQQGLTVGSDTKKENSIEQTQIVNTGESLTFNFDLFEDGGEGKIEHATMYFFIGDKVDLYKRYDVTNSDANIMFDKRQSVHVKDPNGLFEKAEFELLQKDTYNFVLKYDVAFAKEIDSASIVLRTWDTSKRSSDKIFHDAIIVQAPTEQKELPDDLPPILDTSDKKELTKEEPTITKTGFPGIPLWVKNNAMWWHEKQIDDADFVAGIQYMINEDIITIPETEISSSTSDEIPPWISNVAGYWSNDEISDDEFVQAMQWLVSNGVMEVV